MFFPSELGSKDLSDYKNCKATLNLVGLNSYGIMALGQVVNLIFRNHNAKITKDTQDTRIKFLSYSSSNTKKNISFRR